MQIEFRPQADKDYVHFTKSEPHLLRKINALLVNILETPYSGLGKPEALKHEYSGWWSRRINDEHRLVYRVDGDTIVILQCRYHY